MILIIIAQFLKKLRGNVPIILRKYLREREFKARETEILTAAWEKRIMISLFFQLRWGKTAPFTRREKDEISCFAAQSISTECKRHGCRLRL